MLEWFPRSGPEPLPSTSTIFILRTRLLYSHVSSMSTFGASIDTWFIREDPSQESRGTSFDSGWPFMAIARDPRLSRTQIAGQGFGDPEECAYVPAPKRVLALLGKRGFKWQASPTDKLSFWVSVISISRGDCHHAARTTSGGTECVTHVGILEWHNGLWLRSTRV